MKIQLAEPMNFTGITEVWGEGFLKKTRNDSETAVSPNAHLSMGDSSGKLDSWSFLYNFQTTP